ncbi:hypothetical protein YC2023_086543 [Brassica napus]
MVLVNLHTDGQPIIINRRMVTWYLLRMRDQTRNRQSQPVQDLNLFGLPLPGINGLGQENGLQNHEQQREEWVISVKGKMEQALRDGSTTSWDKLCIYRVPLHLQENDKKSYFPQTVSLGPYHHGNKHLLPMEFHKWRAVNMIMSRTGQGIEIYIDAMKELEERARACYQGPIALSVNEFTEMLVLDGCFVLELFRGTVEGFQPIGYARNDPVFAMRGLMHSIQRDMVMLENQLPLFVLDRLLELQLGTLNQTGLVAQVAVKFFDPLMPTGEASTRLNPSKVQHWLERSLDLLGDNGDLHCLDVFRRSLLKFSYTPNPRSEDDPLPLNLNDFLFWIKIC